MARLERARRMGSRTQGVVGAAALVSGSLLLSRLLGLVRVAVFAGVYGTGSAFKDYNAAFRLPDTLFTMIAGGALASAFIPVFAGMLEQRKDDDAWRVANTVLNSMLVLMLLLAGIAFIFAPELTRLLNPATPSAAHPLAGFSSAQIDQTAYFTRIMLIQPILLGLGGLFAAMQNSYQRFILPALAPLVYNLSIVIGAGLFSGVFHFGIEAAAWAVTIGAFLMFEVQIWGVARESWRYRFELRWDLAETREVLRLIVPRLVGLSAYQLMLIVTFILASFLTNTRNTSIFYAWTLIMFPVGAVGTAFGVAVFPTISRQAAAAHIQEVERTVGSGLRAILFLALPATAGIFILRAPIVQLLYAHGSWTPASTAATTFALAFYAFCIPPMAAIELCTRAFYSLRNTRTPVTFAVIAASADAVLCTVLFLIFGQSRGQGGIGLGTALAVWLQFGLLALALRKLLPSVVDANLRKGLSAMLLATLIMAFCVYGALKVAQGIAGGGVAGAFVETLVSVAVGAAIYVAVAYVLRLPEVGRIFSLASRIAGRSATG